MKIYDSITDLIGNTPLLRLSNYEKNNNIQAKLIAKLEYFNPTSSIKDRTAVSMINDAEKKGVLTKDSVIIEPTSGNTGVGLAAVAASRGYKLIITMPETMSIERRNLIQAFGAEIILTEGKKGMQGAIDKAYEISKSIKNSFIPSQFTNMSNPKIHFETTGKEIWEDTEGNVDVFVAGIGTGGTLSGVGEYLKSKNPKIKIIAVEPFSSPILSEGKSGFHKIQGIGAGFIPQTLNTNIYDEIITIKNEDAYSTTKKLAHEEGVLVGISSGACVYAATVLAKKEEYKNKMIVVLLPDTGERYLSTNLFN